jgi:phosphoserine phosphatase
VKDDVTLPGWNDGLAKAAILEFVRSVTTPGDSFVPPSERIAAFDNDGTLWCEKPLYVQADFVFRRFRQKVREDPSLAEVQPYKAVVEGDREWLMDIYAHVPELLKGVTEAFEGITTEAFEAAAREFFAAAVHPTLDVPYAQTVYRPMRELLDFLATNDFQVYICSAGGRDFVRAVCEQVYDLPRDHVIGSRPRWSTATATCIARPAWSSPSTTGLARWFTFGPAPGASPCSPAATPTAMSRCWRRPASRSSCTTTTRSASSPTTRVPRRRWPPPGPAAGPWSA